MEYIALIHKEAETNPTDEEWSHFFELAESSGMFRGGSTIGKRHAIGSQLISGSTDQIGGYMRFDSDELDALKGLLLQHPVILHGGAIMAAAESA
jgi:hypothetical protein